MNRLIQLLILTLLLLFWESNPASSQGLPATNPENVGLSPDRLKRVDGLMREAGSYSIVWDGRDDRGRELASGLYLYRLQADQQVKTRKLLLLR